VTPVTPVAQPYRPPSEPPRAPERRLGGSAWLAVLAASLVFGGFVAYGMLAPATYRTTAQVVIKGNDGGPPTLLGAPTPLERLRQAAIDAETLEQTASALALGSGAAAQATARERIDAGLDVRSTRPDTFEFSFRAGTAEASKRVTDLLARHAAARAVHALTPPALDEASAREAARNKSAGELAAFMSRHPELTPSPVVAPVTPKDTPPETDAAALRAERDQLQAKLARLPQTGSDNPFGEPTQASPEAMRLRRRMAEIDSTLRTRMKAEKKAEQGARVAPEVEREWKRLVQAVAEPVVTQAAASAPAFTVTLQEARLPSAPIQPDRRALALFGALAALIAGLAIALTQALLGRGRPAPQRHPSQPPAYGSEPPRPGSEPPQYGSQPPRPGSEPPGYGSEPPRPGSEPPRAGSEPPRPGSDAPLPANHAAFAATQAVTTAQPILQISGPEPAGGDPRRSSSNPPRAASSNPPRAASSNPPRVASSTPPRPTSSTPPRPASDPPLRSPGSSHPPRAAAAIDAPAQTHAVTRPSVQSPIPPAPRTAPGFPAPTAAPSPPPPPPPPAQVEAAPARGTTNVSKGTLLGMPMFDSSVAEATAAPAGPTTTPAAPTLVEAGARPRDPNAPRSTLRPPPATPKAKPDVAVAAEVLLPGGDVTPAQRSSSNPPAAPSPSEDPPSNPARPARRSSARRTTQVLGSPIPPVIRSSRPPPTAHRSSPPPAAPTTYSYVTNRPEDPNRRAPMDTPPYYQMPRAEGPTPTQGRVHTPPMPAPEMAPQAPRVSITKQHVRDGWMPDPSLDFRARRELADQLFPLAVERCFVVGVSAVEAGRKYKSRVAAELALALAEPRQQRVLLLDADFQWPDVHRTMRVEMPMSLGFSQQLSSRSEGRPAGWTVIECSPTLHVLAEGIMRSPGLILSVRFEESLLTLRTYYDLIVIDGPPASAEVDCRALAGVVDGAIVVSPAAGAPDLARACSLFPDKRFSTVVGI
jgi:Mrp family chromosome partitioning ATPase